MISHRQICCIQVDMYAIETYLNISGSEYWDTIVLANITGKDYNEASEKLITLISSVNVPEDFHGRDQFLKERELLVKRFEKVITARDYMFQHWGFTIAIVDSYNPIIFVEM